MHTRDSSRGGGVKATAHKRGQCGKREINFDLSALTCVGYLERGKHSPSFSHLNSFSLSLCFSLSLYTYIPLSISLLLSLTHTHKLSAWHSSLSLSFTFSIWDNDFTLSLSLRVVNCMWPLRLKHSRGACTFVLSAGEYFCDNLCVSREEKISKEWKCESKRGREREWGIRLTRIRLAGQFCAHTGMARAE